MRCRHTLILAVFFGLTLLTGCKTPQPAQGKKPGDAKVDKKGGNAEEIKATHVECLIYKDNGLPVKVIVTRDHVEASNGIMPAKLNAPGNQPLLFFHPYFVFCEKRIDNITYLQVGPTPRLKDALGWVSAQQVSDWPSNVGLLPIHDPSRRTSPFLVYAGAQALIDQVETGATSEAPMARAMLNGDNKPVVPWPIVELKRYTAKDGKVYELARIHFLGEVKAGAKGFVPLAAGETAGRQDPTEVARAQATVRQLDLVFCIDTTGSMAPYIEAVRKAVRHITEQIQQAAGVRPNLAFGLVAYRDHDDKKSTYLTKHFKLQTSADDFLKQIAALDANGGDDMPEALYDGMDATLTEIDWRQGSHRVICVIADSSGHEPGDRQNPRGLDRRQIADKAKATRAKVFGLVTPLAQNAADAERRDKDLLWSQLRSITKATEGEALPLSQAGQLVDRMRKIMDTEKVEVETRVKIVTAISKVGSDVKKVAAFAGVDIRKTTQVMELLPGAGINVKKLEPGVLTFSTGWVLIDQPGVPVLERHVYISQDDCEALQHGVSGLIRALQDPKKIGAIFREGLKGRAGLFKEFFADNDDVLADNVTLDVFLAAAKMPCHPKSILRFSKKQLLNMTDEERMQIRSRLQREILPALVNDVNNVDLWRARGAMRYGWIREDHLP